MRRFLLKIIFNALALYLAVRLVPGVAFGGDWPQYLLAGLIFALLNIFIRPLLKLISLPLMVITFGLFSFFINIIILWILAQLMTNLYLADFWAYFWATAIISLINLFLSLFSKSRAAKTIK